MKPRLKLVTRADDAGSCRSANEAILEAVEAGTIKNVSFMAVGPEIEHAVEILGGRDDICYGLHVTLNAEWEEVKWGPLIKAHALTDENGHFLPFPQNTKDRLEKFFERGGPGAESIYQKEIIAQSNRLRELGLPISYVDEHMGVSWIGFRDELAEFCRRNEMIDHFALPSLPGVESSGDDLTDLRKRILAASFDSYVWITHPGKVAPDMNRFYLAGGTPGEVARERDAERRLLIDPRLPEMWKELKVKPCRYDEVLTPR